MYYLYIIRSKGGSKFYTGVTKNIELRLKNHNIGGTRSTKPFRPWEMIYKEEYPDKYQAYKREFHLKSPKGFLEKKAILSRFI